MSVILQEVKIIEREGTTFYNRRLPTALRQAQEHAGEQGYIATMPQLVHGRIVAPYDNEIWTQWYTTNSAEYIGMTPQRKAVVIVAHGVGPFTSPERIEQAKTEGLVNYAGKITPDDLTTLLGSDTPSFSYEEFSKRTFLPSKYAIIMDFETAQETASAYQPIDNLRNNPLFIARAGGEERARAFLDKAAQQSKMYGQWHPFNGIDFEQPQGSLLILNNGDSDGLFGGSDLGSYGRFVGVAPQARDHS